MNRLWVRLTLAFVVVAVIGIGLAALLANLAIDNEFRSFVGRSEVELAPFVHGRAPDTAASPR